MAGKPLSSPAPTPQAAPAVVVTKHLIAASDAGLVSIDHSVVAKIVGLAVIEVAGVHALASHGAGETLAKLATQLRGGAKPDYGVHVEIGNTEFAADIRLVVDYGADIPAIAAAIREVISNRVHRMTGLKLKELNVNIVDLWFGEEEPEVTGRELK